ncbi:MAG: WecB/TagA/CpsF family glycosyltransferase [Chitinophagaceae bacterium]|nr:WecB/TagA/CpsF family glycosyltransferase [Chitinophagaceae bacterium]
MKKEFLINFGITTGAYHDFVQTITGWALSAKSAYICVANVHMFIEAHKDDLFSNIINNADMVTPDGKPLVWGLRLLSGIKQERVAGMDLVPSLLDQAEKYGVKVFFYGGTEEMLRLLEEKVQKNYPRLITAGAYSPPFKSLSDQEKKEIIDMINKSSPGLVFVALGCPKQEKWMAEMKGKIKAVLIGVGGALPVLAGIQSRAPKWMQECGLEWAYRLGQEPKRLFKRYATTNSLFILIMLKALCLKPFSGKTTKLKS